MLINELLPEYIIKNLHSKIIKSTPDKIFRAIKLVSIADIPLALELFSLRMIPSRILHKEKYVKSDRMLNRPILAVNPGSTSFLYHEKSSEEILIGMVGAFWKITPRRDRKSMDISTFQAFQEFNEPEYAKTIINFRIHEYNNYCEVNFETRVQAMDARSKRKFILYWGLISPGVWILRKMWLLAIKRRSEHE